MGGAIRDLQKSANVKDRYYDMESVLVDIPILLMTYVESITCDDFLVHYGGHVWFDMAVPFGFIVYYIILLAYPETKNDESKKIQ